jgi:N-acetylglucosaminyldiphosphoundecaprenol N-acetyl-beta-D-mannosaminyltransferase
VLDSIRAANADLVLVALGAPKQELWIAEAATDLRPAVLLGIGAAVDFIAGAARRAPGWMSASGLEWLFRLAQEPRRMWRRYLVRDPEFLVIVLRDLLRSRGSQQK